MLPDEKTQIKAPKPWEYPTKEEYLRAVRAVVEDARRAVSTEEHRRYLLAMKK
jgi:hypothetical protein